MPSELRVDKVSSTTSPYDPVFSTTGGALSHRNLIINGAMQVYQRNASSSTSGGYVADRFKSEFSGPGVTTSRQTLSSGSPYDEGFRHFLRKSNTSVSSATSVYVSFHQEIEAQNIANSGWNYKSASSYITLSFWARSSLAGTYYTQLRTVDGSEYIYYKAFTLSANTWTKVTCTIPGNSNLQFDNDNGLGLRFLIISHYGTNYTGGGEASSETWYSRSGQTDAFLATNFAQNWANTSGATFDLTGVQLERGSVATPFEHRSYAEELVKCQRYYQVPTSNAMYAATTNGSSQIVNIGVPLITALRADPTASTLAATPTAWHGNSNGASGSTNAPTLALTQTYSTTVKMSISGFSGLTDNRTATITVNGLVLDSEL